jgi:hypothetical protein
MIIYKLEDEKPVAENHPKDFIEFLPTGESNYILIDAQEIGVQGDRICIQVKLSDLDAIVKQLKKHDRENQ